MGQWFLVCTHYLLANSVYYYPTVTLHQMEPADKFNIIFMDVWYPGEVSSKGLGTKTFCSMGEVSEFVDGVTLKEETS